MNFKSPLRGIIPPIVTPLLANDDIDFESLYRVIEHVIGGGVHGLFILGTTGEAQSLSYSLKSQLIAATCQKVGRRVPVFVGVTDTCATQSVSLAKVAAEAGAAGLVAAPPYFFHLTQEELIRYYSHLADNVDLPIFLYNIPSQTKLSIEPRSVKTLSKHPRIIGLKDSSGSATYFSAVWSRMKDDHSFSLFVGPDEMLASMLMTGAHGGVSAGANMFPKVYVDLYNACMSGNQTQIVSIHAQIMDISNNIYNGVSTTTSYLKGIKTVLSILGICSDFMAYPLSRMQEKEREIIKQNLMELGIAFPETTS